MSIVSLMVEKINNRQQWVNFKADLSNKMKQWKDEGNIIDYVMLLVCNEVIVSYNFGYQLAVWTLTYHPEGAYGRKVAIIKRTSYE